MAIEKIGATIKKNIKEAPKSEKRLIFAKSSFLIRGKEIEERKPLMLYVLCFYIDL